MRSSSRRLFTLLSFACIIFIATWLRVHEAGSIPPGLHFDEATDLLRSWRVANGYGLPLYFNEAPEPFDAFYRGVLGYFVGHDRVVQRYAISFLSILSVAATMGAAQALYGKQPQRDLMILIAGLAIAVMPASIMVGRTLYRANWVAPMCMLALMWLARAWNTRQTRHYVLCAVFTALGAMFYPAGLFFPPTMALLFGLAALAERRTFPGWRRTLLMALVFIVVMSPWIYLYIRIPGWLTQRLDDLSGNGLPIIGNPAAFVDQLWLSLRLIFLPPVLREPFYNAVAHNTASTALLNPLFVLLFIVGVVWSVVNWRKPRAAAPLVMIGGMVMPGALTTTPEEAIRFIGMFGALALVVGAGAGTMANVLNRKGAALGTMKVAEREEGEIEPPSRQERQVRILRADAKNAEGEEEEVEPPSRQERQVRISRADAKNAEGEEEEIEPPSRQERQVRIPRADAKNAESEEEEIEPPSRQERQVRISRADAKNAESEEEVEPPRHRGRRAVQEMGLWIGAGAGTMANVLNRKGAALGTTKVAKEDKEIEPPSRQERQVRIPRADAKNAEGEEEVEPPRHRGRRAVQEIGLWIGAAALVVGTTVYSWTMIRAHYANWPYGDAYFFTRLQAQADYIRASDVPIYLPLEYMNYRITAAYLRPEAFPRLRAYGGEALPAGELFLPFDASYGTPIISRPDTAYVLLLPETGETVILPPLPQDELQGLESCARETGRLLRDAQGRELGHLLMIAADANPLADVLYEDLADAQPIAVFDDNLEVMDVRAPSTLTAGEFVPVTVYWRLRRVPAADYFMMLQIWNSQQQSYGRHEDWYNDIFFDFAPPPMWTPGQIYAQTRWVQVFAEIPDGGYRFALRVFTYPAAQSSAFTAAFGYPGRGDWLLTARAFVGTPLASEAEGEVLPLGAQFGDSIRLIAAAFEPALAALQAGDTLTVTLEWEALVPPPEDYILFLHVLGENGEMLAQQDARPSELYPTDTWYAGARVTTTHRLTLVQDAAGNLRLEMGLYRYPTLERLPITREGRLLDNGVLVLP